jgi:hypothetical protein
VTWLQNRPKVIGELKELPIAERIVLLSQMLSIGAADYLAHFAASIATPLQEDDEPPLGMDVFA